MKSLTARMKFNLSAILLSISACVVSGCQNKEPTPYHSGGLGPGPSYEMDKNPGGLRGEGTLDADEEASLGPPVRENIPSEHPNSAAETFGSAAGRTYEGAESENYNEPLKPEPLHPENDLPVAE